MVRALGHAERMPERERVCQLTQKNSEASGNIFQDDS